MAHDPNAPLFADRYRFEQATSDWDRGRSGSTDLVYDLKEKHLGVIKRAEIIPIRSTEGIKNEAKALRALKGMSVPEVYDAGQAVYGSKNYDYMVIEYINAIRVEKNLDSLNVVERAEIITQLFGLLSQSHQKGIVNGDVDLKHLFWRRDKKHLVVIDWGNAKLGVDPKKKTEFAYDLARAAEVIFSLVTRQGHPAATGSIALPDNAALVAGIGSLPLEFHKLCKWAPRTPSDEAQAPYMAKELFEVSTEWLDALGRSKRYKPNRPSSNIASWLGIILFLGIVFASLLYVFNNVKNIALATPTPVVADTETSLPLSITKIPTLTEMPLSSVVAPVETATSTSIPDVTPTLHPPSLIVAFDQDVKLINVSNCWLNEPVLPQEGFYRRTDQDWGFRVAAHPVDDIIQADFNQCLGGRQVQELALNVFVTRLQPETENPFNFDEREFGFFLEGQDGHRREYTLWIDKSGVLNLRVREDGNDIYNENISRIVSTEDLETNETIPISYKFSIQIFFQIDDQGQGQDVLYLRKGQLSRRAQGEDINPMQMTRMDSAMFKTLGTIQKIGLVGRGGKTEILIWPLIFSGQ